MLPVLLTLTGQSPKDESRYCIFDHNTFFEIVKFTADLYRDYMSKQVYDFIQFYLKTLKGIIAMDENTIKLCKQIYLEHKDALDLIYDVIQIDESTFNPAVDEFLKKTDILETYRSRRSLWFVPTILQNTPKVGQDNWNDGYPIACGFSKYDDESIGFILQVGPFIRPEQRVCFIKHLEDYDFKIKDRSKKLESKYTRIFTKYLRVKDWSDQEEVYSIMDDLFRNKAKRSIDNLTRAIEEFDWNK